MDVKEAMWNAAIEAQLKATRYANGEFYLVLVMAVFAFMIALAVQGIQP